MNMSNETPASVFFDSVSDRVVKSALIAVHVAWLQMAPLKSSRINLLLLYKTTAAVVSELTDALPELEVPFVVAKFQRHLTRLSKLQSESVDEPTYVELFRDCVSQEDMLDRILSGEVLEHSERLRDPDYW